VKLFNLCSTESITASNVIDFRGYIKQMIDIFGRDNLKGIVQTLVFTQSDNKYTTEKLHKQLLCLIKTHFEDENIIHDFFANAKAYKIDKVTSDNINRIFTRDDIPELSKTLDSMHYQKMTPHIGVNDEAKTFLY